MLNNSLYTPSSQCLSHHSFNAYFEIEKTVRKLITAVYQAGLKSDVIGTGGLECNSFMHDVSFNIR